MVSSAVKTSKYCVLYTEHLLNIMSVSYLLSIYLTICPFSCLAIYLVCGRVRIMLGLQTHGAEGLIHGAIFTLGVGNGVTSGI